MRAAKQRNKAEHDTRSDEIDREIRSLRQQVSDLEQVLREKDETIAAGQQQIREELDIIGRLEKYAKEKEKKEQQLQDENQQLKREKNQVLEEKERQLGRVNQQLEECERVIAQFQTRITELEQLRPATDVTFRRKQLSSSSKPIIKMTWKGGRRAPCKMSSSGNAVADGNVMYVRKINKVYAYTAKATFSSWSQLADSPTSNCPSVIVNNLLTLVGGDS